MKRNKDLEGRVDVFSAKCHRRVTGHRWKGFVLGEPLEASVRLAVNPCSVNLYYAFVPSFSCPTA